MRSCDFFVNVIMSNIGVDREIDGLRSLASTPKQCHCVAAPSTQVCVLYSTLSKILNDILLEFMITQFSIALTTCIIVDVRLICGGSKSATALRHYIWEFSLIEKAELGSGVQVRNCIIVNNSDLCKMLCPIIRCHI